MTKKVLSWTWSSTRLSLHIRSPLHLPPHMEDPCKLKFGWQYIMLGSIACAKQSCVFNEWMANLAQIPAISQTMQSVISAIFMAFLPDTHSKLSAMADSPLCFNIHLVFLFLEFCFYWYLECGVLRWWVIYWVMHDMSDVSDWPQNTPASSWNGYLELWTWPVCWVIKITSVEHLLLQLFMFQRV